MSEKITFTATFQKAGTPDSNGRIYPKEVLKKAVEEYNEKLKSGKADCELNHTVELKFPMDEWREQYKDFKPDMPYLFPVDFDNFRAQTKMELSDDVIKQIMKDVARDYMLWDIEPISMKELEDQIEEIVEGIEKKQ